MDGHLGFGDAFHVPGPIAVGLDRHDNGLGATASHCSCAERVAVHAKTHCNDLRLHLAHRRERVGMQRIRDTEAREGVHNDRLEIISSICTAGSKH